MATVMDLSILRQVAELGRLPTNGLHQTVVLFQQDKHQTRT